MLFLGKPLKNAGLLGPPKKIEQSFDTLFGFF
jgi:hypothetical protein